MFDAPFDIETAMDVMSAEPFRDFPSIIGELSASHSAPRGAPPDVQSAVRSLVLREDVPRHLFKEVRIDDKCALRLTAPALFEVDVRPEVDASVLLALSRAGQGDGERAASGAGAKIFWRVLDVSFKQMEELTPSEKEQARSFLEVRSHPPRSRRGGGAIARAEAPRRGRRCAGPALAEGADAFAPAHAHTHTHVRRARTRRGSRAPRSR